MSAIDKVKADITAKYGKGAIVDTKKKNEEVDLEEGLGDKLKSATKAVKKGIEQENKLQRASGETLDRMKRMTRHKQDKYGPSTLKQRLKTGADHDIDKEREEKEKKEKEQVTEGKKKGLWDNIHAKRKSGEKPAKKGDKDYPKTLNVEHVDIFEEMSNWEVSLLNDVLIEEIITEVFAEELNEGREIDDITDMLCESVDYTVGLLTEVTSPAKVNALRLKNKNKESQEKESPKASKLDRVKSIAKKVGSKLRAGAVKGAEVAGKAAGHAKNLAKDMGSAAKKGYASTQSSSSSSSDSSDSSSSSSSSDSSSSSSDSGPKKTWSAEQNW